ncbi:MAG: hypothetical protein HY535_04675 [Chloroflexi bacterium]|nr:hypothetical protein [Chloroflexota bacterium]
MTTEHRFGTAINCIDGRVQQPVAEWIKKNHQVDFVDMVTEPGPDKALATGDARLRDALRAKVQVSINAHHSRVVAIAGHHNCAANPASREEHQAQVRQGARLIASWGLPVRVVGLWVGPDWKAEAVVSLASEGGAGTP